MRKYEVWALCNDQNSESEFCDILLSINLYITYEYIMIL